MKLVVFGEHAVEDAPARIRDKDLLERVTTCSASINRIDHQLCQTALTGITVINHWEVFLRLESVDR